MLSIPILLVNVPASTAVMDTARAHANPYPVEARPAGTMAVQMTENIHRLERECPDTLLSIACGRQLWIAR